MLPRSMTTQLFRPDRARALREAFRRAESIGPIRPAAIGLAGGLVAAYVADGLLVRILATPLRQIVGPFANSLRCALEGPLRHYVMR